MRRLRGRWGSVSGRVASELWQRSAAVGTGPPQRPATNPAAARYLSTAAETASKTELSPGEWRRFKVGSTFIA